MNGKGRVLVVGIVLADVANLAVPIARTFAAATNWNVDQRWVTIGKSENAIAALPVIESLTEISPKFTILNRVLGDAPLPEYDFVIVTDDDVDLPEDFLDRYLEYVVGHDLALAQPARTHDSYIDHFFVEQLDGIDARCTQFVEIGPLFSLRRDIFSLLLPFDEASPMGWGYDFAWPLVMRAAHLKMGIVDAVPVGHKLRKPVAHYQHAGAEQQMRNYLAAHPHLAPDEAFFILESYS